LNQFRLLLRLAFALRFGKWIHLRRSFNTLFAVSKTGNLPLQKYAAFVSETGIVFGKSGGNKGKWAVCGHSPAVGGGAAGVDADFPNVCGHFLNVGGDFPAAAGG
jgi:hypothetical protein